MLELYIDYLYYISSLKFRSIVITGLEIRCNEANMQRSYKMQRRMNNIQFSVYLNGVD